MKKDYNLKFAINIETDQLDRVSDFLERLLSTEEIYINSGLKAYKLLNDDLLELHGPGSTSSDFIFHGNNQLMSFPVSDMSIALDLIHESGFKLLSEVISCGKNFLFCYVELEPGLVISIYYNGIRN